MVIFPDAVMVTGLCLSVCLLAGQDGSGSLRIEPGKTIGEVRVIAVLPAALAAKHPPGKLSQEDGERLLRFCRVADGKEGPAVLGNYERRDDELHFTPRYPLEAGSLCRAHFGKAHIDYRVPAPPPAPPAIVEKVYPSGDLLPANQLRFYIHFSRPMRGGQEVFDHIQILDAQGNPVENPWLRDELWDEKGQRLILYIHPGRIKWDLELRLLLGPVLMPEREYTLVIRRDVLDADGSKLKQVYRKKFRTTPEDRTRIDTSAWTLKAPPAGGTQPLVIQFDRALDHALLYRFLTVVDGQGKAVTGSIKAGERERSWSFQPAMAWRGEEYTLKINPRLEDTAGNTPERPFDVDLRTPQPRMPPLLSLRFRPSR